METSLHRQLKALYAGEAGDGASIEVSLDKYRIDVVAGDELIEIQHGSLAAIRGKVRKLLKHHPVRVVKPIVARKTLIKQDAKGGRVLSRRRSPKRGTLLDLFDELVYFQGVYPHERLRLDVLLVEVEEIRFPGHGRRRRWRKNDHQVEDQRLIEVTAEHTFRTAADLRRLLPRRLPRPFHTGHLADRMKIERWVAQRIAYCLRNAGAIRQAGKQGNALLYELARS